MRTWAGICDDAMRRAIRGMAAVACVYGVGFGDRRVFSLASDHARTRIGSSSLAGAERPLAGLVSSAARPRPLDRQPGPLCLAPSAPRSDVAL